MDDIDIKLKFKWTIEGKMWGWNIRWERVTWEILGLGNFCKDILGLGVNGGGSL